MSMQPTASTSREQPYPAATCRVRRLFLRPLLLAGAALALFAPPLLSSAHAASLPPLVAQAQQTLMTAQSWKMTVDDATNGPTAVQRVSITVVRHGASLQVYYVATMAQGTAATRVIEVVIGSAHTCARINHQGAWNCAIPSMSKALTQALTLNVGNTKDLTFAAAGTRVVLGQLCVGYTASGSDAHSRGILWINPASKRPVQLQIPGAQSRKNSFTVTWSNWNDPSLTIPNVGA